MRRLSQMLAVVLVAASALALAAPSASAMDPVEVEGTADFRNPPTLVEGEFVDTIVTGETVWYAVVYANESPYRFEVSLPDIDLDRHPELTLSASFVGPTLSAVGSPGQVLDSSGANYPGAPTNLWYLTVTLETTERLGVEYRLVLDIEGVESTGLADCTTNPDCTYDEELAVLNGEAAQVEEDLNAALAGDRTETVERELGSLAEQLEVATTLGPQAEARLARAELRLAEVCSPATECETFPAPSSSTPLWAWLMGLLVLGGGIAYRVKKVQASQPEAEAVAA